MKKLIILLPMLLAAIAGAWVARRRQRVSPLRRGL